MAPSKTFNLAGLQSSCTYYSEQDIREQYKRSLKIENSDMLKSLAIAAFEQHINAMVERWSEILWNISRTMFSF